MTDDLKKSAVKGQMFIVFAGCTPVDFFTATFFLPETKDKTLREIEEHFEGAK